MVVVQFHGDKSPIPNPNPLKPHRKKETKSKFLLVGGFNPLEKYARQMGINSPYFGVNIKSIWVATT